VTCRRCGGQVREVAAVRTGGPPAFKLQCQGCADESLPYTRQLQRDLRRQRKRMAAAVERRAAPRPWWLDPDERNAGARRG